MDSTKEKKADERRKRESSRFRVRGNSHRPVAVGLVNRGGDGRREYVGCSGEKWFSLGFGAAFRFACISSPGGFFSAPQTANMGDGKKAPLRIRRECALPLNTPHCTPSPSPAPPRPPFSDDDVSVIELHLWLFEYINETNDEDSFCDSQRLSIICAMSVINTVADFIKISSYFSYHINEIRF